MADYTKTEPAFDFQKGDFIIINGRRSEVKREITEILTANEDIVSIDNFNMEVDGSLLTVSFTVNSVYGDINDVKGAI